MSNFDKWKESFTAEDLYKLLGNTQSRSGKIKSYCVACPANPNPGSTVSSDTGRCQPNCREYFFEWAKNDPPEGDVSKNDTPESKLPENNPSESNPPENAPLKNKPSKTKRNVRYLVFDRRTNSLVNCTTTRVDALLSKLTQKAYKKVLCGSECPLHEKDCPKIGEKVSEKSAK